MGRPPVEVSRGDGFWIGRFAAMASPCEVLLEADGRDAAKRLCRAAAVEAWRIEAKFSRYRDDNIVHRINTVAGAVVEVDEETADLLDYADRCHRLSDGLFDITSGLLRRAWKFDGSDRLPTAAQIEGLLPLIGWDKVRWQRPLLTLLPGMEIDLGGLGKEYAVDRCAALLGEQGGGSRLVNFGGDIYASGPRRDGSPWIVAIDHPGATGRDSVGQVRLARGGLTTSGDARRFLLKDGVRYGHILDPRSGWPVPHAPRSVTVVAGSCLEAGILSTFAMLHGEAARAFLEAQQVPFWIF